MNRLHPWVWIGILSMIIIFMLVNISVIDIANTILNMTLGHPDSQQSSSVSK